MKTHHSLTMALALAGASYVGLCPSTANAEAIGTAVPKGITALQEKKWAEAHAIFAQIVTDYGETAKDDIGGKFGMIYYLKGNAELNLAGDFAKAGDEMKSGEYYDMARESFEKCYGFGAEDNKNQVKSLFLMAQAQQKLGDYAGAVQSYKKFVAERSDGDKFDPGMLNINMALCHFNQNPPKVVEGISFFETALKNKVRWRLSDSAIIGTFQKFTQAVIASGNEQALVDFLNQNRAGITLKPFQMEQYSGFFQKLATEALAANMPHAAFNLFAMVPGTMLTIDDLSALDDKLAAYPKGGLRDGSDILDKAKIKKSLEDLEAKDREGDPPEVIALSALAFAHESNGSIRPAFAAYQQLEKYFKGSDRREENLFNLTRLSYRLGYNDLTQKYGREFKKAFPSSDKMATAHELMLSDLFQAGEYAECEELAADVKKVSTANTDIHDLALHLEGASKFYQAKFREAQPLLEEHVKLYPESKSKIAAEYFVASNFGKQQEWNEAAKRLDAFLKKYPDAGENIYLPFALFDRAEIAYSLEDPEKSLGALARLNKEFPTMAILAAANNLQGKIEKEAEQPEKALESFKKGLSLSKEHGDVNSEAEALYSLVFLLGNEQFGKKKNPNMKDALPYYDAFWKDHASSPYAAQVAVGGMAAMIEAGRTEEGLKHIRETIARMAKRENPVGLDRAINSYTTNYLAAKAAEGMDATAAAEDLRKHYYSFPGIDINDLRSRALLMFAVLGVYQEGYNAAISAKDKDLASLNQGKMTALFKNMKKDFPVDKLSDQILMSLGDYLRTKTASPREAIRYYEERLSRPSKKDYLAARFGIADVKGKVGNGKEMDSAIKDLRAIYNETKDAKDKDSIAAANGALNRIVAIYAKQEKWDKAISEGLAYLKSGNQSFRKDVMQVLAQAYDKKGEFTDAIAQYNGIANNFRKDPAVAIPAMDRVTELMWNHGKETEGKSRKQNAYEYAAKYILSSKASFEKTKSEMPTEAREAWLNIDNRVKKWEKSGQIKTLEQLAAEKG